MSSLSKACLEISNSIKGFRLGRNEASLNHVRSATNSLTKAFKQATNRVRSNFENVPKKRLAKMQSLVGNCPTNIADLFEDVIFLSDFFKYFTPIERTDLAMVCSTWKNILYERGWWTGILCNVNCKQIDMGDERHEVYFSLVRRNIDAVCLVNAVDGDVDDLLLNGPTNLRCLTLKNSSVTDRALENLLTKSPKVYRLELIGCNELTETGFWSWLTPNIISLSISDCINVADDAVGAVAQLLPSLHEFNLQAYHVTDSALAYFTSKQCNTLSILRLISCWELTNHALVNIVQSLPNLTVVSLSGCSKITDDGVEILAESLKHLKTFDLSWCCRITDASLEAIACDLNLDELILDRCAHVTDIGLGYLSCMKLTKLYLRWCIQIRDNGIQHLLTMKTLRYLSLAGCSLIGPRSLMSLGQLPLLELELTNCASATPQVLTYLQSILCEIIR